MGGDEVLWLRVGYGLVRVSCFPGVLNLPVKMFNSCCEAMSMVFFCSGVHSPNELFRWGSSLPVIFENLGVLC